MSSEVVSGKSPHEAKGAGMETERRAGGGTSSDHLPLLPVKSQDVGVLTERPDDKHDGYSEATFSSGVFNLSTTIVGAGIMAIPATMKVLGLPLGLVIIAVAGLLTDKSIQFLNRYSQPFKARSYGGLMAESFGKWGRTLTQLCIIINNGGILIVYVIIIGDVLSGTSEHTGVLIEWCGGPAWWNSRHFVLLAVTVLILAPLSSLRHVDQLKHSSALSMALAGVFLFITVAVAVVKLVRGQIPTPQLLPAVYDEQSFWRIFTVVPVMVTAYICHHNLHPIANELKGAADKQMQKICRASIVLCSSIYLATALFGFLLFGDDTSSDILSNFDADLHVPFSRFLGTTVRLSYAVHVMLVFPLLNFSLRLNLDSFLFPRAQPLATDTRRFALTTLLVLVVVFLGATLLPSIWTAIEFTGATASVCLGFIFPAAIALRDVPGIATRKDKLLATVMIIAAVVSSVSAITTDIIDLIPRNHS